MKLTVKQPIVMLLTFAVIGAIFGSTLLYLQVRSDREHQQNQLDHLAGVLVHYVEQDMLHSSPQILEQSISGLNGAA